MKAEKLADKIFLMDVHAPRVASHCEPGQFVIVKMDEKGERIPLTICDYDREAGTITIVVQEVGASTTKMGTLKEGDYFRDFTGPLGCASEFVHEDLETLKNKKMDFCDTDALIVEKEKKSINDIFSENGEPYFRELETEIVKDLIKSRHNTVVSVGGGLPLKPENRELLKKLGTVVYLRTSVEELTKRLAGDTTRPLLAGGNIREKITHLMDMRLSDYLDAAEVIIDTDGRSFDEMYENILKEKREA